VSLANYTTVKSNCGFTNVANTALLTVHIPTATQRIVERIGQTIYDAIDGAAGDPYTAAAKTGLIRAESLIAGALVLRALLHQVNDGGVVQTQFGIEGQGTAMATAKELNSRAASLEALAYEILAPWEQMYRHDLIHDGSELSNTNVLHVGRLTLAGVKRGLESA
jgi:hypothetical protein